MSIEDEDLEYKKETMMNKKKFDGDLDENLRKIQESPIPSN